MITRMIEPACSHRRAIRAMMAAPPAAPLPDDSTLITLGLLSDSHGRSDTTTSAVQLLIDHGADALIHLGDVGSVQVIDALAAVNPKTGKQIESHLVFGNCDWNARELARYARVMGIHVHEPAGALEIDGQRVGFCHGHEPGVLNGMIDSGFAYVLQGHTHVQADRRIGQTRLINPGALFRAKRHTVALLTPADGRSEVLEVATVTRQG